MLDNPFYSQEQHGPYNIYDLSDFDLEEGGAIPNCQIAYASFGKLNAAKDNAIIFPHMFSGTSKHMEIYVGEGMALDPTKYFILLPNMIGAGLSSSPHNSHDPISMANFPNVTIGDDVRAQYLLATQRFGITAVQLVLGWSMGAQQTFEWAVRYPDLVKRAAPIGGTAKGTAHNYILVENAMRQIRSDSAWQNGNYKEPNAAAEGLKNLARFFSMIGLSKEFYAQEIWRDAGFNSLEEFETGFWEAWFSPMDPNALLASLRKWQHADVSKHTDGDLAAAMGRIKALVFNMPFEKDLMFTVDECKLEHELTPYSELRPIPTLWGHFGMLGVAPEDKDFINGTLKELLSNSSLHMDTAING
ncbi:MAG: alpha/beta fold hydrolase [Candidatus Thiodiazotropha sp.]